MIPTGRIGPARVGVAAVPFRAAGVDERGFTLIEIIVALVIVAMATALVVPAIDSGLRAREVRSAVRNVTATFRSLKTEAVRSGRSRSVVISLDENALEVEGPGGTIDLGEVASLRRVEGGEFGPYGASRIRFHPNGSSSGVALLIGDRDFPAELGFVVSVDPLIGHVTVRDEER